LLLFFLAPLLRFAADGFGAVGEPLPSVDPCSGEASGRPFDGYTGDCDEDD
jgi:hypothetical protein